MKKLTLYLLLVSCFSFAQTETKQRNEIIKFQSDLNKSYKNVKDTPLRGENYRNFKKHPFFPVDLKYRIKAKFVKTDNATPFEIPTSSGETQPYVEYGKASFVLDGDTHELSIYQSQNLITVEGYEDYLFLPFRDATNGKETYGGGKYMDLRIPQSGEIILDFNKSYQPYCAYNAYDYSCPIVPEENFLSIRIEAGVMYKDVYH